MVVFRGVTMRMVAGGIERFGMLLEMRLKNFAGAAIPFLVAAGLVLTAETASLSSRPSSGATQAPGSVATSNAAQVPAQVSGTTQARGLNVVVLDPAHGGIDYGARGAEGVRESEVVMEFAAQVRRALESQGFQVVQTRTGNENPSFDDRSAMANAQQGAVFVSLHIASTGLPGTVRVYVNSGLSATPDVTGLIPWDRAQGPFVSLSEKLGDLVQGQLRQRFRGSPDAAQSAAVRQLRTTAAPAIAVEVSSVIVENRNDLDRMAPGVGDAIARGVVAFRPSYVVPTGYGVHP